MPKCPAAVELQCVAVRGIVLQYLALCCIDTFCVAGGGGGCTEDDEVSG